jgi:hypothetical protein
MNPELKERSDIFTEQDFLNHLNDDYPEVKICGYLMQQGTILYRMDQPAFREEYNNYLDACVEDVYICGECGIEHTYELDAIKCCEEWEEEYENEQDLPGLTP